MKKILFLAASLFVASFAFLSCDDEETYAEQKEREARQIKDWLADNHISVISMSEFLKDSVTDTTLNEYVLFEDNGVYMQIVNRGGARLIESGETWYISARYEEIYIPNGELMSINKYDDEPDIFYVERDGGNYTASFISGVMYNQYANTYGNASIPNAWLMPFPYIKPGMLDDAAKVRLIVPHNQGTQRAATSVYPTFYEISISTKDSKVIEDGND